MFICARSINENVSVNLWEADLCVQGLDIGGKTYENNLYIFVLFEFLEMCIVLL